MFQNYFRLGDFTEFALMCSQSLGLFSNDDDLNSAHAFVALI